MYVHTSCPSFCADLYTKTYTEFDESIDVFPRAKIWTSVKYAVQAYYKCSGKNIH